jgi:hypothetical protein
MSTASDSSGTDGGRLSNGGRVQTDFLSNPIFSEATRRRWDHLYVRRSSRKRGVSFTQPNEGGRMSEPVQEIQAEIEAINAVLSALAPLDERTRRNILGYVLQRFGVDQPMQVQPSSTIPAETSPALMEPAAEVFTDVRTLKEKKEPANSVEMAVLVAYYLSELAPSSEKRETIGTDEISKYFQQADYQASGQPRVILHRAKNAGYLDSAERGQYKLNPVGRNLAKQGLPRLASTAKRTATGQKRAKRKTAAAKKRGTAKKSPTAQRKSARSR